MDIEKDIVQAVVVMDTFNKNFNPLTKPMALMTVAGVPMLDLALESLSLGKVGEVILFCCYGGIEVRDYVRKATQRKAPWSLSMEVQVMSSDTCQTMGDVMREIDAAGIIRGNFILMGINTVTNIPFSTLLEQHKQACKKDKGAAMTLVYKKMSWDHQLLRCDKPVFIAADGKSNKILHHQKYTPRSNERSISLPLETVLNHSEVKLHHNLADANIAFCSPSVPPLFADNFDFQTRDDFIHGILINEELLASSLYYILLKQDCYAASINNWKTYQIVSRDLLHHWVHPLSIDTGNFYQDNFVHIGNHNYRHKDSTLSRSCRIIQDVLISQGVQINDNTTIDKSHIGKKCIIGSNVTITNSHLANNVIIKDNCRLVNSYVDDDCIIEENCELENGSIVAGKVTLKANTKLKGSIMENDNDKILKKSTSESGTEWENESSGSEADEFIGYNKVWSDSDSYYSSASSGQSSLPESPLPDDTNIFLQEVVDSLTRGYEEKLKCDYLILEINSSRYAYNIQLHEVNFFVVRALLSMPVLENNKNVVNTIKDIFKFFKPVLSNYIKSKSSVKDCLRAVEDSCINNVWLEGRAGQVVHLLYDFDVIEEDSLTDWYENLKKDDSPIASQTSLVKFFEWLTQASEESEDSD